MTARLYLLNGRDLHFTTRTALNATPVAHTALSTLLLSGICVALSHRGCHSVLGIPDGSSSHAEFGGPLRGGTGPGCAAQPYLPLLLLKHAALCCW